MRQKDEDRILQILRVEEPATLRTVKRFMPDMRLDLLDAALWELNRQGRVHCENAGELWLFGTR